MNKEPNIKLNFLEKVWFSTLSCILMVIKKTTGWEWKK
jgi:hypothetical protein